MLTGCFLTLALLLQMVYPQASTSFDGVTAEKTIQYLLLDGSNGARLPLGKQMSSDFDYTIKVWLRPESISNNCVFELRWAATARFEGDSQLTFMSHTYGTSLSMGAQALSMNRWVHLGIGGERGGITYLTLDYADQTVNSIQGAYVGFYAISAWSAAIGITHDLENGFSGGVRDFFITN